LADWEADSPRLQANLARTLSFGTRRDSRTRLIGSHRSVTAGLATDQQATSTGTFGTFLFWRQRFDSSHSLVFQAPGNPIDRMSSGIRGSPRNSW
jgi:hypothetical protein